MSQLLPVSCKLNYTGLGACDASLGSDLALDSVQVKTGVTTAYVYV